MKIFIRRTKELEAQIDDYLDKFILVQPRVGDEAFEIMGALIETGEVAIVVLDSVALWIHTS